jgi:hypothetical protein
MNLIGKSPIVKNLIPGLTERGKIKIGRKGAARQSQGGGTYQLPEKLDHFVVTGLTRDGTGNFIRDEGVHRVIGEKPTRIPIQLMFDALELNFQCRYACYYGKTLFCSGDGEAAWQLEAKDKPNRIQVPCTCYRQEPTFVGDGKAGNGKCKINGTLSVIIQGADSVGGVYKFRTTGYNSTVGILSSLTLLKSLTGGYLAGLPLVMTVQPKVCTNPVDGSSQTVYVVGVEYAGSMADLQKTTLAIAQGNAEFRARLVRVEDEARKLISADAALIDEAGDITEEYYPPEEPVAQLATPPAAPGPTAAAEPVPAPVQATQPVTTAPAAGAPEPARRGRKPRQTPAAAPQEPSGPPAIFPLPMTATPAAAPAPAATPTDQAPVPLTPMAAPANPPAAANANDLNLW